MTVIYHKNGISVVTVNKHKKEVLPCFRFTIHHSTGCTFILVTRLAIFLFGRRSSTSL